VKRIAFILILLTSTYGCVFHGGTSSPVLGAEVWQNWKSGRPVVLSHDFTVVYTVDPLEDNMHCLSKYIYGGIPENIQGKSYVLPKGTKIYVKEVRKQKDFIEVILPIFPIYIKSYYVVLFTESAAERDIWKEVLRHYGFKRESDILKMLQDGSL
jgi:hypothetical protein